ncbi:neutral zinc metallopeptidase [Nonomuraea sp. NPDC002799]
MPLIVKLPIVRSLPFKRATALVALMTIACVPGHNAQAATPHAEATASAKKVFPKKAGRLADGSCPETAITAGGIPRSRQYLETVVRCLDKSWSAYFDRAGLRGFVEPVVRYYEEPVSTVCGGGWPDADAFYCIERGTVVFPLDGGWIRDRTDLYPFKTAAHEYGHHLQWLIGWRRAYGPGEPKRRYELQADCLAGVFMGSVWSSLARGGSDWAALLDAVRANGDEGGERRTHGKGINRAYWLQRGYRAVSPAACDTWSAPAAKVA